MVESKQQNTNEIFEHDRQTTVNIQYSHGNNVISFSVENKSMLYFKHSVFCVSVVVTAGQIV